MHFLFCHGLGDTFRRRISAGANCTYGLETPIPIRHCIALRECASSRIFMPSDLARCRVWKKETLTRAMTALRVVSRRKGATKIQYTKIVYIFNGTCIIRKYFLFGYWWWCSDTWQTIYHNIKLFSDSSCTSGCTVMSCIITALIWLPYLYLVLHISDDVGNTNRVYVFFFVFVLHSTFCSGGFAAALGAH